MVPLMSFSGRVGLCCCLVDEQAGLLEEQPSEKKHVAQSNERET